jgi:ATP-dependent Lon protease
MALEKFFPVLPLRDVVVYPHMVIPLFVGRKKSIEALDSAMRANKQILLVAQKDAEQDDPGAEDVYRIGTLATILQLLKLPDGTVKVLVEGNQRSRIEELKESEACFIARAVPLHDHCSCSDRELDVLMRTAIGTFDQYLKLNKRIPPEVLNSLSGIDDPGRLADTIAAHMTLKLDEKQAILEMTDVAARLERLILLMEGEVDILELEKRIRSRVKQQMEKNQREYYLNEQLKAIQKELGELEDAPNEIEELAQKIAKAGMPKETREKAQAELNKLKMMSPMSAEATVVRNYLDWLINLPWKKQTKLRHDLKAAQEILDADHYGLDRVKERILEYLAVQQRVQKMQGPILCLVGPPGVGKTSLGQSIAKATNRKYVRMALGGIRDEAEIRGHRRTYIGSMPGKIIQSLVKVKSRNPVFMLDEIDKMAMDFRGDPASALLEVLDPEQNKAFNDHYLEVDFDLSDVMFIATANTLNIPPALLDRMEIIRLPGYTEEEKLNIAKRYLIPKQLQRNGLKAEEIHFSEGAILEIIRRYTREAGVRNLEREIASICRKTVKRLQSKPTSKPVQITARHLLKHLGVPRFRYGRAEETNQIGQVTGLAWTEVGGELLTIEAVVVPGKGKQIYTGKLGEVMQESIQAAITVVRSRAEVLGIDPDFYHTKDMHIHVPEGATPKDGPSAGIGMCTALVSALTGIPVRCDVAMTGEITLRGEVLPIGGLKEKLLAALRGGIRTVIIPSENQKDLIEIPANVKQQLEIVPVRWIDQVLELALEYQPSPLTAKLEPNKRPALEGKALTAH